MGMSLGIIGVATFIALLWGVWVTVNQDAAIGPEQRASVRELAEKPDRYVGSTVRVVGELGKVMGPGAFSLVGAGEIQGEGILVVGSRASDLVEPGAQGTGEEIFIQVTGPVRVFDQAAREEFGTHLGAEGLAEWEGKPMIVAQDLARAAWVTDPAGVGIAPEGGQAGGSIGGDPGAAISLAHVIENILEYRGDTVTVDGFVVKEVSSEAIAITATGVPGNLSTLVVARDSLIPELSAGDRVRVTGEIIQRFDIPTMERALGKRLDPAPYGNWRHQPSIVASEIRLQ